MRAFVFTDARLSSDAGQVVWLSINTEQKKNVAFLKKYPIPALPSFFVLDPSDETVALRWIGGASVTQVHSILADGRATIARRRATAVGESSADALLAQADRAFGEGRDGEAGSLYLASLRAAPAEWAPYARVVESALFCLSSVDSARAGVELAESAYERLRATPSVANVVSYGLGSAVALPDSAPDKAAWRSSFEARARTFLADQTLPVSADDKSGVYGSLIEARSSAGDSAGAHALTVEWAAFLEGAAARAATSEQRAVFDPHRVSAYIELHQPEKAIPMLEESARDFPQDYNPPARLAIAYKEMRRYDAALAASDRAMALVYGPRKLRVYAVRIDILTAMGDAARARSTLVEEIAYAEALPDGQRSERAIASLKKKLEAMNAEAAKN
jgi:tetratricopeptide (TPR) repeat protein